MKTIYSVVRLLVRRADALALAASVKQPLTLPTPAPSALLIPTGLALQRRVVTTHASVVRTARRALALTRVVRRKHALALPTPPPTTLLPIRGRTRSLIDTVAVEQRLAVSAPSPPAL